MRNLAAEMPPRPISREEYHDYNLVGLSLQRREAELLLESPDGLRTSIKLVGVERLLGMDVLEGNIIDCIDCHAISAENVRLVLGEFRATGSGYFGDKSVSDIEASGALMNKTFVAVRPIHGASILAVAASVMEIPVSPI